MNSPALTCDDRHLLSILRTEDAGSVPEELRRHIEDCAHCQQRLEELAATPAMWQKASDALSHASTEDQEETPAGEEANWQYLRWADGSACWCEALAQHLLSPPSHPEMLGRLGRYEVERMIGAGGMGVVFKAFDAELNRPVAIKVLAPFLAGSGAARKRFAREARAAAAIVHEHVVPIHNVETDRESPFLVMQYIAGESLQSRIDRTGPLQTCEILRIGLQIASGLSAAHQQGLVHRDIKPSNILLEQGVDRALISDFGLARTADDAALTRSGVHPGTPQFMSPEQASGDVVDARSDLFSLGSVLYTIATGRPPFRAATSLGVLRRIADDEPRRIREINPNIPEWLCGVIDRLMAKRPAARFQTAAEVADLLSRCLAHVQQPDYHALPPEVLPRPTGRQRVFSSLSPFTKQGRRMYRILVVLIALLGGSATFSWLNHPPSASLNALQGEWLLVAEERSGRALPATELFNERLIIDGSRFSRPQTAPDGTEIAGESGRVSLLDEPAGGIDFRLWPGTCRGLYRLAGDELVVCVTRQGGPRPDSFATAAGDARSRYTYRRQQRASRTGGTPPSPAAVEQDAPEKDGAARQEWIDSWIRKITSEVPDQVDPSGARTWLQHQGFQGLESDRVTGAVLQRIWPAADPAPMKRRGPSSYVYGRLVATRPELDGAAVEVYYLFDDRDKLVALQVGPQVSENPQRQSNAIPADGPSREQALVSRSLAPLTRPVMSLDAPIIACIGPAEPVCLGAVVAEAEIGRGLEPEVVFLHVWDWSVSDWSRVLLVQRSEFGALSADGTTMLTQQGETIDLNSKRTFQHVGFQVPEGQRITAVQMSPARRYAAALIHLRTDVESLPTDPPTVDTRHFWNLRLLRLSQPNQPGQRVGEYAADARPGVAFLPDESSVIYSTDQRRLVRRQLSSGDVVTTYDPPLGVQGAVGLAVSPDGRLVAAAGYDGTLWLWETHTGTLRFQREAADMNGKPDPRFQAHFLRFSPDSSQLLLVAPHHVKVVDAGTGDLLRETRDATRPRYAQAHWSADGRTITLLTSAQRSAYDQAGYEQNKFEPTDGKATSLSLPNRNADILPRVYVWRWEQGEPEIRPTGDRAAVPAGPLDPAIEVRRFTGTWRVHARTTGGIAQTSEIGQAIHIRHARMGDALLEVDPNQTPRRVDIVFVRGPEKGKVLKGIYEWIPDWRSPSSPPVGTGEAVRICTFLKPHPARPDERPTNFEPGKDVDTAVWECLSHNLPNPPAPPQPTRGTTETTPSGKRK
ncbi:MAG: protein kinase [Pirellulales bacterium]